MEAIYNTDDTKQTSSQFSFRSEAVNIVISYLHESLRVIKSIHTQAQEIEAVEI